MRLELSAFVEGDLDRIAENIAEGNPRRAVTFVWDIRMKLAAVARDPLIYQLRPDIGEGARLASVGRYAILFRVVGDVVRVERVVWGGRELPETLSP